MKNNQKKEGSKKFNLEKVEVLKLDTMRKITGGNDDNDPDTGTNTSKNCSHRPNCKDVIILDRPKENNSY
jgi:hypothetical protein